LCGLEQRAPAVAMWLSWLEHGMRDAGVTPPLTNIS